MAQTGRCLAQGSSGVAVRKNWLLLDSCSTISWSKNNSIISNATVIPLEEHLSVYINEGHMDYTMIGTLGSLPTGIYVNYDSM